MTNYITINRGAEDRVQPGMAVISPLGVVGKVKAVSKHFSVVTSVLHRDYHVSVLIKRTGDFGSALWDGTDPAFISLNFVPRHVNPVVGDTIITSGYNAIFPQGTMVGTIAEVKETETLFYDLKVKLSQDFRKLSFVEVVRSRLRHEQDSLELPFREEPR